MTDSLNVKYPYDDSSDTTAEIKLRCRTYDFHNFAVSFFNNKFPILQINIRSTKYKIDELSVWLNRLNTKRDVICLSETSSNHWPAIIL